MSLDYLSGDFLYGGHLADKNKTKKAVTTRI